MVYAVPDNSGSSVLNPACLILFIEESEYVQQFTICHCTA
jgi:hypothetical protein